MMGGMAILQRKWCDYIVYCEPQNEVFCQRLYFDPDYWNNTVYPEVRAFIENHLKPILTDSTYPIIPGSDV